MTPLTSHTSALHAPGVPLTPKTPRTPQVKFRKSVAKRVSKVIEGFSRKADGDELTEAAARIAAVSLETAGPPNAAHVRGNGLWSADSTPEVSEEDEDAPLDVSFACETPKQRTISAHRSVRQPPGVVVDYMVVGLLIVPPHKRVTLRNVV